MDPNQIYSAVQERYGSAALSSTQTTSTSIAKAFGYTKEELSNIPLDANLGLSCGNPLALAGLKSGETVIDLGSGAGFDVFLAATRVGPMGRVVGVDMNDAMLTRARLNAEKTKVENVEFVRSNITEIGLPDEIADCVISNCVINLVPESEKPAVFREMFRLLKPSGRVAISDILARKPLDEEIKKSMALYVGCIAGASQVGQYEGWLGEVGFVDVVVVDAESDLNIYKSATEGGTKGCCDGGAEKGITGCCGGEEHPETKEACCENCCGNSGEDKGKCCERADCCHKECCDMACCRSVEKSSLCCGGGEGGVLEELKGKYENMDFNEWAGSFKIYAVKP